jgi:flagellar biosynthesis protein FlhB
MMVAEPKASVIIVNPTIRWRCNTIAAGRRRSAFAKAADHLAFKTREIAAGHDIRIAKNVPAERGLYATVRRR